MPSKVGVGMISAGTVVAETTIALDIVEAIVTSCVQLNVPALRVIRVVFAFVVDAVAILALPGGGAIRTIPSLSVVLAIHPLFFFS